MTGPSDSTERNAQLHEATYFMIYMPENHHSNSYLGRVRSVHHSCYVCWVTQMKARINQQSCACCGKLSLQGPLQDGT
eukprot:3018847-Pleurochrysis_carterae.AAC.1